MLLLQVGGSLDLFVVPFSQVLTSRKGVIQTPALTARIRDEPGWVDTIPKIPQGRFGETEEVGSTVAFLLGDDSSHITSQVIPISGGITPH